MADQTGSGAPPSLPQLSAGGSGSVGDAVQAAGTKSLEEMEQRVQEKANVVQNKATELQELEARLEAAERKKAELEAKGIKM